MLYNHVLLIKQFIDIKCHGASTISLNLQVCSRFDHNNDNHYHESFNLNSMQWYGYTLMSCILNFTDLHALEKATLTELSNGTVLISWDPIVVGSENTGIKYRINISSNSSNSSIEFDVDKEGNFDESASIHISRRRYTFLFEPGNLRSACEVFTVFITPIVNDHYPGEATPLTQGIIHTIMQCSLCSLFLDFVYNRN